MAIAVLIANATDAEQLAAIGLDLASRVDRPLVALCIQGEVTAEKKPEKKSERKTAEPQVLDDTSASKPAAAGKIEKGQEKKSKREEASNEEPDELTSGRFENRLSYLEPVQTALAKHAATAKYGFITFDAIEVPPDIDSITRWLGETHFTDKIGEFHIDTLFIPVIRGAGVEQATDLKTQLFENAHCEVIYLSVDQQQSAPLPLKNCSVIGEQPRDIKNARRFVRRLGGHTNILQDPNLRDPQSKCVIVGIAGKARQTRVDKVSFWKTIRKDPEIPVAMIFNPANSWYERLICVLDDRLRRVFRDYQMTREKRNDLAVSLDAGTRASPEFILFMSVATTLACIGLIQDSAAVIIGAMLVAPLMTPLLGAGLALNQGHKPLFVRAIKAISIGVVLSFLIGMLVGLLSLGLPKSLMSGTGFLLTNEMISRSQPNLLDPLIGFASGLAGGFAIGRDGQIGTVAGVAIAAALVPPIATAGLEAALVITCFAQHDWSFAVLFEILSADPGDRLSECGRIATEHKSTVNALLISAPMALFVLNACTVILGAFLGLRMVGMHRSRHPKESKPWVSITTLFLLFGLIVFLMALPFVTKLI